jgi:hypothetical protein
MKMARRLQASPVPAIAAMAETADIWRAENAAAIRIQQSAALAKKFHGIRDVLDYMTRRHYVEFLPAFDEHVHRSYMHIQAVQSAGGSHRGGIEIDTLHAPSLYCHQRQECPLSASNVENRSRPSVADEHLGCPTSLGRDASNR